MIDCILSIKQFKELHKVNIHITKKVVYYNISELDRKIKQSILN